MADALSELCALLESRGVTFTEIPRQEQWLYGQRWRECYSAAVKAGTGKWTIGHWDWNTFDHGYARCRTDAKALAAFLDCSANAFIIIPERGAGLRCSAPVMPDLSATPLELYVFPPDLEWTMVFSHEGTFFSRRAWHTGGD
jgi:hypothetical protein